MSELGGAVEPRQLLSKPAAVAVMRGGVEAIWIVARREHRERLLRNTFSLAGSFEDFPEHSVAGLTACH